MRDAISLGLLGGMDVYDNMLTGISVTSGLSQSYGLQEDFIFADLSPFLVSYERGV